MILALSSGQHSQHVESNLPGNSRNHLITLLLPAAPTSNWLHKAWWKSGSSHCLCEQFFQWPFKQREVLLSNACQRLFCRSFCAGYWKDTLVSTVSVHCEQNVSLLNQTICACYTLFKTLLFAMFEQWFIGNSTYEVVGDHVHIRGCKMLLRLVGMFEGLALKGWISSILPSQSKSSVLSQIKTTALYRQWQISRL